MELSQILTYTLDHWEAITGIVFAVISIANKLTSHYSNHAGFVKALLYVTESLSFLTSADARSVLGKIIPILGHVKIPLVGVKPLLPVMLAMCLCMGGCAHVMHARSVGAPWTDAQCQSAARKKTWLLAVTSGLAVAAGGTGIATPFPDGEDKRIVMGSIAAADAIGAAVAVPFLAQLTADLHDHCQE